MHFAKRNQRALVIGREHMNKWPLKTMNYIRKNSFFFPVHNTYVHCTLKISNKSIKHIFSYYYQFIVLYVHTAHTMTSLHYMRRSIVDLIHEY